MLDEFFFDISLFFLKNSRVSFETSEVPMAQWVELSLRT